MKHRYVVQFEGVNRQILTVEENRKNELLIFMRNREIPDALGHNIKTDRYTVHESPSSHDGGFMIKSTSETKNGALEELFHYVYANKYGANAIVCGFMPSRLSNEEFNIKKNNKDILIDINQNPITFGQLFIFLIVSIRPMPSIVFNSLGLMSKHVKYRKYNLYVVSGIFPFPPNHSLTVLHIFSKPERINGVAASKEFEEEWRNKRSMNGSEIKDRVSEYIFTFAKDFRDKDDIKMDDGLDPDPLTMHCLRHNSHFYYTTCLSKDYNNSSRLFLNAYRRRNLEFWLPKIYSASHISQSARGIDRPYILPLVSYDGKECMKI